MVTLNDENVIFLNRNTLQKQKPIRESLAPILQERTFENAKKAAPGYDIYGLHQEWISHWIDSGKPDLKSPDGAFIGFCKNRHKKSPIY
jgi:hypothetical protein